MRSRNIHEYFPFGIFVGTLVPLTSVMISESLLNHTCYKLLLLLKNGKLIEQKFAQIRTGSVRMLADPKWVISCTCLILGEPA